MALFWCVHCCNVLRTHALHRSSYYLRQNTIKRKEPSSKFKSFNDLKKKSKEMRKNRITEFCMTMHTHAACNGTEEITECQS